MENITKTFEVYETARPVEQFPNTFFLKGGKVLRLGHSGQITSEEIQEGIKRHGKKFMWGCCYPAYATESVKGSGKHFVLGEQGSYQCREIKVSLSEGKITVSMGLGVEWRVLLPSEEPKGSEGLVTPQLWKNFLRVCKRVRGAYPEATFHQVLRLAELRAPSIPLEQRGALLYKVWLEDPDQMEWDDYVSCMNVVISWDGLYWLYRPPLHHSSNPFWGWATAYVVTTIISFLGIMVGGMFLLELFGSNAPPQGEVRPQYGPYMPYSWHEQIDRL